MHQEAQKSKKYDDFDKMKERSIDLGVETSLL